MLRVENLVVRYGTIEALHGVSLAVERGAILALIGANGAGKSTLLRAISGLQRPSSGRIVFEEEDITRLQAHRIVARGVCQVPEGRRLFPDLSVSENLDMGAFLRRGRKAVAATRERVYSLFPILAERARQLAGTLSGGEQQMLAIGRALMGEPRLLLLDEPSLGLAPTLVSLIFGTIERINRENGVTILLVEQNANMALRSAHYGCVLETGQVRLTGTAERLRTDENVKRAYLGG